MLILTGVMVAMALLAVGMIIGPLLAKERLGVDEQGISRAAVNSSVFKDRLKELQLDLTLGTISQEEFEQLKAELELGLLNDVSDSDTGTGETSANSGLKKSGLLTAISVFILVPLLSFGFYYHEGYNPQIDNWLELREEMEPVFAALAAGEKPGKSGADRTVIEFVSALQRKAQEDPDNASLWHMLGMSYLQMEATQQAEQALRRAYRIEPENVNYRLALAQLLIGMSEGKLERESEALLLGVLEKDSKNMQALAMLGMAEFFDRKYQRAVNYWETLLTLSKQYNSPQEKVDMLVRSIAAAKKRIVDDAVKGAGADGVAKDAHQATSKSTNLQISVTVDIEPSLRAKLNPNDTLFVYAQKSSGPKMPLAAIKQQAGAFPVVIILSDEQAMTPQFRLSTASTVIVKARISATNNAISAPGDFIGESDVVDLTDMSSQNLSVNVEINSLVP